MNIRAMQSMIACLALVCISHVIAGTDSVGNNSNTRQEKLFRWVEVLGYSFLIDIGKKIQNIVDRVLRNTC